MLVPKISKIELKHCHSRQDRMYGSRILILGSLKKLWYVRSAENPTPTWLRFQQLDSASGETATSSNPDRLTRIQFLQIPYRLQDFQRFLKNPQCSSSQVAQLPVQWMPFPQYPLRSRMEFLLQELQRLPDILEHPEEAPKEFHPKAWTTRVTFRVQTFLFQEREMLRYGSEWHYRQNRIISSFVLSSDNTNCKNDIQLFLQLFDELSVYRDYH